MEAPISDVQRGALLEAVKRAGDLLLSLWPGQHRSEATLGVKTKADGTFVSQADLGSNEILMKALTSIFPGDAILSEEVAPDLAALSCADRVWVIDPLDGTKAFLDATDQFSVLVGLCEHHAPTFGVMFFPARQELVLAERGRGVAINGNPITVSSSTTLTTGRVYIRNFECSRPELASPMMDSGLALKKVAQGELDGAIIRMTTHREWDIAAPIIAIKEAGGRVSNERAEEILCGTGSVQFQYLIASNGVIHQNLLSLIP